MSDRYDQGTEYRKLVSELPAVAGISGMMSATVYDKSKIYRGLVHLRDLGYVEMVDGMARATSCWQIRPSDIPGSVMELVTGGQEVIIPAPESEVAPNIPDNMPTVLVSNHTRILRDESRTDVFNLKTQVTVDGILCARRPECFSDYFIDTFNTEEMGGVLSLVGDLCKQDDLQYPYRLTLTFTYPTMVNPPITLIIGYQPADDNASPETLASLQKFGYTA